MVYIAFFTIVSQNKVRNDRKENINLEKKNAIDVVYNKKPEELRQECT